MGAPSTQEALSGSPLHKRPYLGRPYLDRDSLYTRGPIWTENPLWMGASFTQEALSGQKDLSRWGHPLHERPYLGRRPSVNGGLHYSKGPI